MWSDSVDRRQHKSQCLCDLSTHAQTHNSKGQRSHEGRNVTRNELNFICIIYGRKLDLKIKIILNKVFKNLSLIELKLSITTTNVIKS